MYVYEQRGKIVYCQSPIEGEEKECCSFRGEIINLTPQEVVVNSIQFPASGIVAKVVQTLDRVGTVKGLPLTRPAQYEVKGLPEPKEGVIYIVSAPVQQAANRPDCFSPAEPIRNEEGVLVGYQSLGTCDYDYDWED